MNNPSVENRIKEVRKAVHLNQVDFGLKLGVSVGVISNIELHRNKTDIATDPICNLICSIFNVNKQWLFTGEGDMFNSISDNPLSSIKEQYNLSDNATTIIEAFLKLSKSEQDFFIKQAERILRSDD